MAIGMMNFGWENEVLALLWEDGMGGRSKQRIFNSFKRKKKEIIIVHIRFAVLT